MTELYTRDLTDSERFELESDLKLLNSDLGWAAIPGRLVKGTMAGLGCAFIPAAILCLFGAVVVGLSLGVAGTILGLSLSAVTAPSWWRGLQARREALREDLDKGFAEVIKVTA